MGCSQAKTKELILGNLNYLYSAQNEGMIRSNFGKEEKQYNIIKNPIIMRRIEKKNQKSQTTACNSTWIA